MFVRQNQQQFRNSNADVQIFYGSDNGTTNTRSWNKPPGVSHVYMLLIGRGGSGNGTTGGGSGAVTVWYGAAQNVPDQLEIRAGTSASTNSVISNRTTSGLGTTLLQANTATTSGGTATTAGLFAASGFYQSTAGQAGSTSNQSYSGTTFLAGGGSSSGGLYTNEGNYKYFTSAAGYFLLQPIIVGVGGLDTNPGGIGCGGGVNGAGGQGMVLIASW